MGPRAGTKEFIECLKKRKFSKCQEAVIYAKGRELPDLIEKTKFCQPFLVTSPDGLDLRVPPPGFSVRDVVESVGQERLVDVIDVHEQHDFKMSLGDFFDWFHRENRGEKIYNVLSLEISDSPLSEQVIPPRIVRELSLVNRCWPEDECPGRKRPDEEVEDEEDAKPEVLKFCLMSAGQSYTDFHIDFGGSSVWYHVLWGEKLFYLIPPTDDNLDRYEAWMESPDNLTTFLGDLCPPGGVYQLRATTGNTIVLPAGWIHAVYTPCDSLVFGGNFLHLHSVEMQIRIHEMEQRLATERRFQFPMFEKLHWYAAQLFLEQYQGDMDEQVLPELAHVESMRYMVQALTRWYDKRRGSPYQSEYVPDNLQLPPRMLLREFEKLIEHFHRAHGRRRVDGMAKTSGGIKLKIKRQSETKGNRKGVKHVIENVGGHEIGHETPAADDAAAAAVACPGGSIEPIKRRSASADEEGGPSADKKKKKKLKKKQKKANLKRETDEDESDEGIDVAKCTEDDQFYYPAIDEHDSGENDSNWRPKSHSDKQKLRDPAVVPSQSLQKQPQQPKAPKPKAPAHASTAKQRLGKKLGLFKLSR